jgi:putative transposase
MRVPSRPGWAGDPTRKRTRHTAEQTIRKLKTAEQLIAQGKTVADLCLAIRVGRLCKAKDVVAVLEELTSLYPAPTYIRSDTGPEFMAQALRDWRESSETTSTAYIEPGSPWEKGFAESFNRRFRVEFLNTELFTTAPEAQLLADRWRWDYKTHRPHSTLQGNAPLEAAQQGAAA